ncbi:MAG: MoaD/ThiS family protein [Bacteroidota bacterium]
MSTFTIKYFGVVAEVTGRLQEETELKEITSVQDALNACLEKYPELKTVSFKIAHNQKITESGTIEPKDEIAFLPPFSGG